MNELAKRTRDFQENKLGFVIGDNDYIGHVEQYIGKQINLRKLLNKFLSAGCNCIGFALPQRAWWYATKEIPNLGDLSNYRARYRGGPIVG